jgi:hypothetical protein
MKVKGIIAAIEMQGFRIGGTSHNGSDLHSTGLYHSAMRMALD